MDQATNLRNIIKMQGQPKNTARVLTVTSGKGGVGKTSISINLAIALSKKGKKVIVLDADFGLANIEVMLGIRPEYTLADLMFKGMEMKDIVTQGPEGIGFISCGSGIKELANITKQQLYSVTYALSTLDNLADVVIVDTGAGIEDRVMEFAVSSAEVLLIVTPEPTSITDAYALLKTLNKRQEFVTEDTVIKLVANKVRDEREGREIFQKMNMVVSKFLNVKLEFLGVIPEDEYVSKAVMHQKPLTLAYPNATSSKAISQLSNIIESQEGNILDKKKGILQIFKNILRYKN